MLILRRVILKFCWLDLYKIAEIPTLSGPPRTAKEMLSELSRMSTSRICNEGQATSSSALPLLDNLGLAEREREVDVIRAFVESKDLQNMKCGAPVAVILALISAFAAGAVSNSSPLRPRIGPPLLWHGASMAV